MNPSIIADALFTKTQQRVLAILFSKPEQSVYLNEIVRVANIGKGTIKRELERMTSAGLLTIQHIGNQTHYQAIQTARFITNYVQLPKKRLALSTSSKLPYNRWMHRSHKPLFMAQLPNNKIPPTVILI